MSLTSILSAKENQALRDKLKADFLRPEFNLKTEIKAPPLTNNYGIVGTAFDYLTRFQLRYVNRDIAVQRGNWVADHAFSLLSARWVSEGAIDVLEMVTEQYNRTKSNYADYIQNGNLTDELIENAIFLAKLDNYFRAKVIEQSFDAHNPEDIKDLKALVSLLDLDKFVAKEKCYFNPTFGAGSSLVGGADADLIIDNTLIDIKTTKHLKLEREHLNQVIGYYILSLIGGVNNNPDEQPIENIGIYFARHGELWTIPIRQLGTQSKFEDFKDWFVDYASR
jgi:hypothetical protein